MKIRERALTSEVHTLKIEDDIITIKRIKPPLLSFVYSTLTGKAVTLSQFGNIEIPEDKLESYKKKAIAFAKSNITDDNGRSI